MKFTTQSYPLSWILHPCLSIFFNLLSIIGSSVFSLCSTSMYVCREGLPSSSMVPVISVNQLEMQKEGTSHFLLIFLQELCLRRLCLPWILMHIWSESLCMREGIAHLANSFWSSPWSCLLLSKSALDVKAKHPFFHNPPPALSGQLRKFVFPPHRALHCNPMH